MEMLQAPLFEKKASPQIELNEVLSDISRQTQAVSEAIKGNHKKRYSQYFTPMAVARQMAGMLDLSTRAVIGDYGAGTGILGSTVLGASIAESASSENTGQYELRAYEIDELLHDAFKSNMERIEDLAVKLWQPTPAFTLKGDFTAAAPDIVDPNFSPFLDAAILNPPYQKLNQSSQLAKALRQHAVSTPNLYAAFILLAVLMLRNQGQLVAIVPRSFCNGDYFKPFRQWLRSHGAIDWFVRYRRRSNVFRADNVLQENVIFRFRKGLAQPSRVRISLSDDPEQLPVLDSMMPTSDVLPDGDDRIYVPATAEELAELHANRALPCSLDDLGLTISTGKFEQFRYQDLLTGSPRGNWAPMVYSQHWKRGASRIRWSEQVSGKPACMRITPKCEVRLHEAANYVLLKRISANDDRTGRCHPAVVTPDCLPGKRWAFENHVQVIAAKPGEAFSLELAEGIRIFLSSPEINQVLRTISGTTQLNCNDIRKLRFPTREELFSLGEAATHNVPRAVCP